jgi:biopolymer transport protein ExbB
MQFPLFTQIEQAARDVLEQQTAAPVEPVIETISIWQLIVDGGWYIMGPMGIMSIMAFYIIIERSLAIRRALKEDKDFMNKIKDYIHEGKIDSARNLCAQSSSPISRMLDKGISRIGKPLKDIEVSIENAGKLEIYQLEKGLSVLATIAGAAPMLGFLGTVIGMIVTFHTMKISGAGVEISDGHHGSRSGRGHHRLCGLQHLGGKGHQGDPEHGSHHHRLHGRTGFTSQIRHHGTAKHA